MRAVFLGRKSIALKALDKLVERGWDLLVVVPVSAEPGWAERPTFAAGAADRGFDTVTQQEVLQALDSSTGPEALLRFFSKPVDLVISYLYPERVRRPLLELPRMGAINFHPAPLPEFGGMAGYNLAIVNERRRFGVTAHVMVDEFDAGPILEVREFELDPDVKTAFDLERRTRPELLALFRDIVTRIEVMQELGDTTEQADMRYVSGRELERMKHVDIGKESAVSLSRKVRGFWYPPYDGAYIEVDGKRFTLVDDVILSQLASAFSGKARGS